MNCRGHRYKTKVILPFRHLGEWMSDPQSKGKRLRDEDALFHEEAKGYKNSGLEVFHAPKHCHGQSVVFRSPDTSRREATAWGWWRNVWHLNHITKITLSLNHQGQFHPNRNPIETRVWNLMANGISCCLVYLRPAVITHSHFFVVGQHWTSPQSCMQLERTAWRGRYTSWANQGGKILEEAHLNKNREPEREKGISVITSYSSAVILGRFPLKTLTCCQKRILSCWKRS